MSERKIKIPEPTLLEAAEEYSAWCNTLANPEYAAHMRLYWAQKLHRQATVILSSEQDRATEINEKDRSKKPA